MKAVFILFIFALCLCSHVLCAFLKKVYLSGDYCNQLKRNTCYENCKTNGYTKGGGCNGEKCYCAKPPA
ncbi:hypothetical protein C0J52_24007 [Blattella germanica]|nr:hypothetical protein C0J52_24007 [Blattella germanica]